MGNKQKLSLSNLTMILRTFPMAGEKQKTPNRLTYSEFFRFYNLVWGAKVTVQMRVLSAPTFFSIKK